MARNQISSVAFGQVNSAVRTLPGASVSVLNGSGGAAILYASEEGSETLENPVSADRLGRYEFFVSSSEESYTITVTLGPVSYSWTYYPPDNVAAAGLIYEETWVNLVGRTANLDGAAAEVTNDAGTHSDATASGYDGGEVDNLGRYRWNEAWGRWARISDAIAPLRGQPFASRDEAVAARIPGSITSIEVATPSGWVLSFKRDESGTALTTADGGNWSPAGDVFPDHWAENSVPGTTNMRDAIEAAADFTKYLTFLPDAYLSSGAAIVVPTGSVWSSVGYTTGYGGSMVTSGCRIIEDRTASGNVFEITGASSSFSDRARCQFIGISFESATSKRYTNLSEQNIKLFGLTNTFLCEWINCNFNGLNLHDVIAGVGGSNNGVRINGGTLTDIGDANAGFAGSTGRFTYGNGINTQSIPDSFVQNVFVELCGRTGIILGANCKAFDCFNDLCWRGYEIYGYDAKIDGGSCKWHRTNGVYVQANATDWSVLNITLVGNNYANATGIADDTFAIRLTTGHTGWKVAGIDARDEISANHPSKTQLQNFIKLSGAVGNTGVIDGVQVGDTPAGGNNFYDPNGALAAGNISIRNVRRTGAVNNLKGVQLETAGFFGAIDASVQGAAGSAAITLGAQSSVHGVVESNDAGTLFSAPRSAIGPFVVANEKPTTILDQTGAVNTGAISISGFSYPAPYVHTGGGLIEENAIAPLPSRALGMIQIAFGDGGINSFFYCARIKWDGSTLTVTDELNTQSNIGTFSLAASGGNLVFVSATSTALSANMVVRFDGVWMRA